MQLDSVQIGADDLAAATAAYTTLLGVVPVGHASGVQRLQLERGAIELEVGQPGVRSLRFTGAKPAAWPIDRAVFNGLDIRAGCTVGLEGGQPPGNPDAVRAIDHVVINTPDLERAIALWRDRLGIRLALDREFPQQGLRMCFFRSGGMTLEFVSSLPPPPDQSGPDRFYGIAYDVADLTACRARLLTAGLDVSEIRPGNKRGTRVATVRSGTAGVPTLLIEASE
jgi:catechol 2,3-dioxygenase-like lactoylglutathione lyase family enzyme